MRKFEVRKFTETGSYKMVEIVMKEVEILRMIGSFEACDAYRKQHERNEKDVPDDD